MTEKKTFTLQRKPSVGGMMLAEKKTFTIRVKVTGWMHTTIEAEDREAARKAYTDLDWEGVQLDDVRAVGGPSFFDNKTGKEHFYNSEYETWIPEFRW